MEEYARSTTKILHGLAITILVLSSVIVLIAIVFIALKNHPKLQEKNNPVKVIYIIGFILLIICVVLAIVYLCKKDKLEETSAIYKKYVDKECFNEAPIKNACKTISSYAADVESRFAKYALIFFISSLVLMLVGFLLAVWRKGS
jgi:cytochrome bd-type quinol oxidase subunit 2